ncbi:unnamed protein product [Sphagnum troendelagicum]|uniref:Uncharacterized protein n=1 Tax=Sphagnum troendelagicum TaxID=128251 RepID=A0ABP0U0L5_9BRYO
MPRICFSLLVSLQWCISSMQFQQIHSTKCLESSHSQLCTKETFTTMTMKEPSLCRQHV